MGTNMNEQDIRIYRFAGRTGLMAAASSLADILETIVDRVGRAAGWLGLAMVLLALVNVILRYAFSIGPVALQELEWHLMPPLVLIGMSYAMRHDQHVRIDLLYEHLPRHGREFVHLLTAIMTIVASVVVIVVSLPYVGQAYASMEGSPDPGGLPYRFVLRAVIPLGFLLLLFQGVALLIKSTLSLLGGPSHGS